MARKDVIRTQLMSAQSMAASSISPVTICRFLDNCSYQVNITTSNSTGTFTVQSSDDYDVDGPTGTVTNPGHWVDLPIGGTPTAAGANDSILINLNQLPFNAIRIIYTAGTAGTGHFDLWLVAKQIGG